MSGKNVLDGFSCILDIQKFSGWGPPDPPWKIGYMEWTLILQNSPHHHHYQPARCWGVAGERVQALNFRQLGALSKNAYYWVSVSPPPPPQPLK